MKVEKLLGELCHFYKTSFVRLWSGGSRPIDWRPTSARVAATTPCGFLCTPSTREIPTLNNCGCGLACDDDFVGHVSLLSFVVVLLWPTRPHTLVSASLVTEVQG